MGIGTLQTTDYRTDYAGYSASGNQRVNEFYDGLSSASEKSDSSGVGDVLGLTMIRYSDSMFYGMSAFYSDQSTEKSPIIRVSSNYGGEQRYYDVHVNDVNPRNASQLEMFALSCYQDDKGITDGGTYGSFTRLKAYAGNAADNSQGIDLQNPNNASAKLDWVSMLQGISNVYMQNSQTYSQYLDCSVLASTLEKWSDNVEETSGIESGKNDMCTVFHSKISEMAEKLENGDTEPTYQIGGQSFTEEEWEKIVEKIDKDIEQIQAEQAERLERQKTEQVSTDSVSNTNSDVAGITRYYNGKEVNYQEDMLHDRKMYDAETGVTWYLNDERGPYIAGEDSEKLAQWCKDNGVSWLKKFADMTGLVRNYPDGSTAYIADNGIVVKRNDGTKFTIDYTNASWYALMDAVNSMQKSPLDKQTWNKVMQDYEKNKVVNANFTETQKMDRELTEEQAYKLFTDANERAFNSYGPNASDEVKKAWIDAAEKTGTNGAGMASNGMATHITAMSAERAVRWINGDDSYADILGDSVDSAIIAAEKALYDLENPLQPINSRTPKVQKQIKKEKQFYEQFLENLKQ